MNSALIVALPSGHVAMRTEVWKGSRTGSGSGALERVPRSIVPERVPNFPERAWNAFQFNNGRNGTERNDLFGQRISFRSGTIVPGSLLAYFRSVPTKNYVTLPKGSSALLKSKKKSKNATLTALDTFAKTCKKVGNFPFFSPTHQKKILGILSNIYYLVESIFYENGGGEEWWNIRASFST